MPLSMKIQPIDASSGDNLSPELAVSPAVAKPVVKSRLRRLFRISTVEKDDPPPPPPPPPPAAPPLTAELLEPSSVCLAKMVQNFIEENNERQSPVTRCGRNRCNCFNGSDGSDGETENVSASDVCEFLKSLVICVSVNERNVLDDTAKIVADKNKSCKRKDELRKIVSEGLVSMGYDAAICKSKWEKSPSFPAGEYEYVDVIIGGERLIIDIDFRSEFEVARSTKTYKSILQTLPPIFVGKSDRLSKIICILSEAAKQSLKKKGMHIPPWRKVDYVQAKWLSPPTRLASIATTTTTTTTTTPPPSPLTPVSSSLVFKLDGASPDKAGVDIQQVVDDSDLSQSSPPQFEAVFDMSESSGEEEVKVKGEDQKGQKWKEINPKKNGLASIIQNKPKP